MNYLLPQSCLILEVPEAEAAVGQHREKLDAIARLGVPAHFTVLFPFMTTKQSDISFGASRRSISGWRAQHGSVTTSSGSHRKILSRSKR